MRRLSIAAALAALPLVARAELVFPVPAGWLDLSPGAPEDNFRNVPPDFVRTVRSGQFKSCAFDLAHTRNGFTPNLNVIAIDRRLRVRDGDLKDAAAAVFGPIQKQIPGATLVEQGIVEIDGVNALRIVYDSAPHGAELRQMAVVVPGVPASVVVTYTALRSQFAELRPAFDAHAASIRGAEESSGFDWGRVFRSALIGALIGAIAAAGAGAVAWFRKRKA